MFTHLLQAEFEHYTHEIGRVLKPGGRCLASLLTLDHYQRGVSIFPLEHRLGEHSACWDPHNPTKAIAFTSEFIDRAARHGGLFVRCAFRGSWDGTTRASYAHDMYVFEKMSG